MLQRDRDTPGTPQSPQGEILQRVLARYRAGEVAPEPVSSRDDLLERVHAGTPLLVPGRIHWPEPGFIAANLLVLAIPVVFGLVFTPSGGFLLFSLYLVYGLSWGIGGFMLAFFTWQAYKTRHGALVFGPAGFLHQQRPDAGPGTFYPWRRVKDVQEVPRGRDRRAFEVVVKFTGGSDVQYDWYDFDVEVVPRDELFLLAFQAYWEVGVERATSEASKK